jgi:hypothetical protein
LNANEALLEKESLFVLSMDGQCFFAAPDGRKPFAKRNLQKTSKHSGNYADGFLSGRKIPVVRSNT